VRRIQYGKIIAMTSNDEQLWQLEGKEAKVIVKRRRSAPHASVVAWDDKGRSSSVDCQA